MINDINKVLENDIKETMTKNKESYCPICNSKLAKVSNTYMRIEILKVWYCPKGHYYNDGQNE